MINFRMLVDVLRHSGFGPITCVFAIAFLICSAAVWLRRPRNPHLRRRGVVLLRSGIDHRIRRRERDGAGGARGSRSAQRPKRFLHRAPNRRRSVSYCTTALKARQEGTLANFAANLERLDEMTPEELAAFSARVREYRRTR